MKVLRESKFWSSGDENQISTQEKKFLSLPLEIEHPYKALYACGQTPDLESTYLITNN